MTEKPISRDFPFSFSLKTLVVVSLLTNDPNDESVPRESNEREDRVENAQDDDDGRVVCLVDARLAAAVAADGGQRAVVVPIFHFRELGRGLPDVIHYISLNLPRYRITRTLCCGLEKLNFVQHYKCILASLFGPIQGQSPVVQSPSQKVWTQLKTHITSLFRKQQHLFLHFCPIFRGMVTSLSNLA